jgi:hypothetical protein
MNKIFSLTQNLQIPTYDAFILQKPFVSSANNRPGWKWLTMGNTISSLLRKINNYDCKIFFVAHLSVLTKFHFISFCKCTQSFASHKIRRYLPTYGAFILQKLFASSANIRPGWKSLTMENILSSLLRKIINYECKKFCETGLR